MIVIAACAAVTRARSGPNDLVSRTVTDSVRQVLERALADSAFPAAYAVVGTGDRIYTSLGVGHLDWGDSPPPDENTLWDLASLTKVIGTTTAVMQLWERGALALDDPVQRYVPGFIGDGKSTVTIRDLLSHSSGLPAWRPLYKETFSPAEAHALADSTPLDTVPNTRFAYSDLGAIVLGHVVERISGVPLDRYLEAHVFAPLGMSDTRFLPPAALRDRIAPTEIDPWRGHQLRGEVHDENAAALGGVAGHAGLFSSARDLTRFARMLLQVGTLDGARIVSASAIDTFTAVRNTALSNRALGWEVPTGENSAGHRMGPRAFGHTGFTGTSLWVDRERHLFVLLLTNRVNPTRMNTRIGGVRIALADAVEAAIATARPDVMPPFKGSAP